jgi:hypothetical protein
MANHWGYKLYNFFIYVGYFMIIIKAFLFIISVIAIVYGLYIILNPATPDSLIIPIQVSNIEEASIVRSFSAFHVACGYLTLRFIYSSSKVQISSILIYIITFMLFSKLLSFYYDGFSLYSMATTLFAFLCLIALRIIQVQRKNQISYDL